MPNEQGRSNEMVERVTIAIQKELLKTGMNIEAAAKAAIAAMREPTEEMMVEAETKVPGLSSFNDMEQSPSYQAWQAMIDAALKGIDEI